MRIAVMCAVLWAVARPALDFRVERWGGSVLLGVAIFAIWIAPDLLFPGFRHSLLFENPLTGAAQSSLSREAKESAMILALRSLRAIAIVPIVEELFWRAWLMRWLIRPEFESVPLGAYTAASFWITAVLFAAEHGSYWDVGLIAGILFNWWMLRRKSLGDLILAHAVANGCLSAYVIAAGKWEYWL